MKKGKRLLLLSALLLVACGGGNTPSTPSEVPSSEDAPVSVENSSEVSNETTSSSEDAPSSEEPIVEYSTVRNVVTTCYNMTKSAFSGLNIGDELIVGETINAYYDVDFEIDSEYATSYIIQVNNILYRPSDFSYDETNDSSRLSYSIVVPEEDMEVFLVSNKVLETSDSGFKVTLIDSEFARLVGYDVTAKFVSEFRAQLWWDPGFAPTALKYRAVGTEEWIDSDSYIGDNNYTTFYSTELSALGADVEVKLEGEYVGAYNITYINAEGFSNNGREFPTISQPGKNVNFEITSSDTHYSSTEPTITGIDFENATITSSRVSFVMPENDVTIEFHVDEKPTITFVESEKYTFAKAYNGSNPQHSDQITVAEPGEEVYVFVDAVDGYSFTGIKVNGGEEIPTTVSYSGLVYAKFIMPEDGQNVSVEAVFVDAIKVSLEFNEGGTLVTSASSFVAGSTVRVNVKTDDSFHALANIYVKDHEEIVLENNGDYYTFTMPEFEVTVVGEFVELEKTNVTVSLSDDSNIEYFSLYGYDSSVSCDKNESRDFIKGEQIDVGINTKNQSSVPSKLVIKDTEGNEIATYDYGYDQWGYGTFGEVYLPENYDAVIIDVIFVAQNSLNYSIDNHDCEGYTLKYQTGGYNSPYVDDLGTVYPGTTVKIEISGDAGEGFQFIVYITDLDGNIISDNFGTYTFDTDFVIHVEKVQLVTYTAVGYENIGMFGATLSGGINYYESGQSVPAGTVLSCSPNSGFTAFKVELIVGGEVVETFESEYTEYYAGSGEHSCDVSFVAPESDFTLNFVPVESTGEEEGGIAAGTYYCADSGITMTLNEDGTGSWNDGYSTYSFEYDIDSGDMTNFAAFDGGYNKITVNDDGSLSVLVGDSYYENMFAGDFIAQ